MSTTADRDWLDGPGLLGWLIARGARPTEPMIGRKARAVRHWREGAAVSVWIADEVLTRLGFHLSELPGDLWRDPPDAAQLTAEGRRKLGRLLAAGKAPAEAARAVGCSTRTAQRYATLARAGEART